LSHEQAEEDLLEDEVERPEEAEAGPKAPAAKQRRARKKKDPVIGA
jgi:hypothetical protein